MLNALKNCQPQTYAALRIFAGFLFLWHGAQKLLGFPAAAPDAPWWILYIAGPIELIGGALIMFGLFTRPLAFLASGLMAFAYFLGHVFRPGLEDPGVLHYLFPLVNRGESAVLFCFVFLYIAAKGNGICSLGGDED